MTAAVVDYAIHCHLRPTEANRHICWAKKLNARHMNLTAVYLRLLLDSLPRVFLLRHAACFCAMLGNYFLFFYGLTTCIAFRMFCSNHRPVALNQHLQNATNKQHSRAHILLLAGCFLDSFRLLLYRQLLHFSHTHRTTANTRCSFMPGNATCTCRSHACSASK